MIWDGETLSLLDQTRLPVHVEYIRCADCARVEAAIRRLEVRGAPAIGAAAAFGFVLGARKAIAAGGDLAARLEDVAMRLKATRPTAVNLFWAVNRMADRARSLLETGGNEALAARLEAEALAIYEEDKAVNRAMAAHGATLFSEPVAVLTHCNAGALATVELGTALGVVRVAHAAGKITRVYADETRPLLQGARLTAFELLADGIPVTLLTDNMTAWTMKQKAIGAVIVGADRIAANGDVANKIGTYGVALLAKAHGIPFYVAAPASTFDFSLRSGDEIPIEERDKQEVTHVYGVQTAPEDVDVFNPAFDVTPHALVTAIVTEYGILRPDYAQSIQRLKETCKI